MSRNAKEIAAAAVLLVLFSGLAWLATDFGPRARMIPLPLAIIGAALAVVQIASALRGRRKQHMKIIEVNEAVLPQSDAGASGAPPTRANDARPEWTGYAIVVGLTALILAVGPVIAIFVFTGAYFLRTRLYSAAQSLIYAALFTGGVYLLFFTTLQIEPYYGLLAPLIAYFR